MRRDLPTGTVTFVFTDIEGSTRMLEELGTEGYGELLGRHHGACRAAWAAHGGVEVDTAGDAFFVAFPTASGAVAAAAEAQDALAELGLRVRMGVHTGEASVGETGYVGFEVHRAARIAGSAHGGQVVVSASTAALVPADGLVDLGEHRFKDVAEPVSIFQLGNGSFPPLKTVSNTNLPRPASSFVGRERELAEVVERIERGARLVTLTGPGGSGKTRLALEAAVTLLPAFRAGVFWVGLAALRDPGLVTETIAQTLGAKDGLAEHVGERELLLLLDNMEQVIDAAPDLARLLRECPSLTLVVTSRELMRVDGEVEYAVPPLAEVEAVALFHERARIEPSTDVRELCARLDNLPLAVELAAARTSALSPKQILERLSHRLDLLRGGRDADPRQQTLRATIEWSYELLEDEEQQLFRALSVFAGGCTLDAAEQVADAELDTLQSLVEKSLVRYTNERYWMLETIKEYAVDRHQGDDGLECIQRRHAEHYLAAAEGVAKDESEPLQPPGIRVLGDELDNLRAARAWFHDAREGDAELRLVCALAEFWDLRGHLREAWSAAEAALDNDAPQSPALRARALAEASDFARPLGAVEQARRYSEESLALFRQLGDDAGIARALHELGEAACDEEDFDRGVQLFGEAIEFARRAGQDGAASTGNLGYVALLQGDYRRAAALAEEALALFRHRRQTSAVVVNLGNLAEAEAGLGRHEKARHHLEECLALARETGFRDMIVQCMEVSAAMLFETGDAETSARLTGAVDALLEEIALSPHPIEQRRQASLRAGLRTDLGASVYELRDAGGRMPVDDACELALEALRRRVRS